MAISQQHGPNMRELFGGNNSFLSAANFEYDQKETKTKYDLKKKQAQPSPSGLGQYKPKILSGDPVGNVPLDENGEGKTAFPNKGARPAPSKVPKATASTSTSSALPTQDGTNSSKPFLIGDKDTPMVLYEADDVTELVPPLDNLTLMLEDRRQFPNFPAENDIPTQNPLFMKNDDGDADLSSSRAEPAGVFIPAPDYYEEEKTIEFADDSDLADAPVPSRGKQVFREYGGEDFSHYLVEDETESVTMRPQQASSHTRPRSQTEVKRSHYKKRGSLSPSKRLNKKDIKTGFGSTSSLRNFTYADSKFGTVARTEKTRASVSCLPDGDAQAGVFVDTGSSYETFLRSINGEFVNGGFANDESGPVSRSKPDQSDRHQKQAKGMLWKRLTLRLK